MGRSKYDFREGGWDAYASDRVKLVRQAENTQFFQVITVDGDRLSYEARTATGELYDDVVMSKTRRGVKKVVRGATSTMEQRSFANTGSYESP